MMEVMALRRPRLDGWNSWNGDGWMDGGMGGRVGEPWSGLDIGTSIYCIDHGGGMGGTIWMNSWSGIGLCIEKGA